MADLLEDCRDGRLMIVLRAVDSPDVLPATLEQGIHP